MSGVLRAMARSGAAGVAALALLLALAGQAAAQAGLLQPSQRQPPPAPERVYPDAPDRPLKPPDVLADDRIDPDSGVQIRLGPHAVALNYPALKIADAPTANLAEGVAISVDILFGAIRLGYTREFYRREISGGRSLEGKPVNLLAVDADQLWATLGWRPSYNVYLGAGLGGEYRLVRLRQDTADVRVTTDSVGIGGIFAEYVIAPPFSLQLRIVRELAKRELRLDATTLQVGYQIPF